MPILTKRLLFFVLCAVVGVSAGWWWSSGQSLRGGHADDRAAADEVPADVSDDLSATVAADTGVQRQRSTGIAAADTTSGNPAGINAGMPVNEIIDSQAVESAGGTLSSDPAQGSTSGATAASGIPGDGAQPYSGMPSTAVISYHDGIMKVAPAVVSLYATDSGSSAGGRPSGSVLRASSQGSGVIVDADGVVLTNLHLVEGLDRITVVLSDGRSYPGIVIGSDRETDLAVVRIAASNLPFVQLDDAPPLRVGDVVLAIGNPFGVGQTVTQGIVSATHRRVAGGSVWQHFVQIDAAINPGNSGGALINPYGQLVGVNTAIFRGDSGAVGIGFSIPADLLAQVVPQIIEFGSVARGWLGIGVEDLRLYPVLAAVISQGAVITSVLPNSPASQGGLRDWDVITHINEQPVDSATQVLLAVSAEPPGSPVTVRVLRRRQAGSTEDRIRADDLQELELTMTLDTREDTAITRPR